MERVSIGAAAALGVSLGLGIAVAGFAVTSAAGRLRDAERHVTVKGLSEREVDADLAIWPLSFQESANDLVELQRRVEARRLVVSGFMEEAGFRREDISYAVPRIADLQAERRDQNDPPPRFRYVATAVVMARTRDVKAVRRAMEKAGTLVAKGVVLGREQSAEFLFTALNSVKPAMIEEATVAAREAAAKFAKDSGSKLGKIRAASQGLFSIEDRDAFTPERKVIRVVSTVEYLLDD